MMNRMRMASVDLIAQNIEKLGTLFPNCITEIKGEDGKWHKTVNFDKLRMMLSNSAVQGDEAYEFTWVGKKKAIVEANKSIRMTLRPCPSESKDWDTTENLYIEGDNLRVMKLLQENYLGAIKMIYIDPPYNTGSDFIYPDTFVMDSKEYNTGSGYFDENGNVNYARTNGMGQGRYHSDWCSMIYSRLMLARNLLKEDGAIFISIDDNEVDNLKKICGEIFGEANYVATFPWRKRTAKSDVPFGISQDYEWIICYAKSEKFLASVAGKDRKYYETPDFPGRPWRVHDLTKQTTATERPNSFFTIVNPQNGEQYPANPNRTWAITEETFKRYYAAGRIVFPGDYEFLNIQKPVLRYWKEDDMVKAGENFGRVAVSTKLPDEIGMSQDGTKEITDLLGGKVFSFPKPSSLIQYLAGIHMSDGDTILDFFSGSATTAHAIMNLNAADGGHRKYILVQLPEPCNIKSEAYQAGYKNICEIGKERIRRAGKKIVAQNCGAHTDIDIGFRVFKLSDSNMNDVYYCADEYSQDMLAMLESNIRPDRTDLDLLFGCLLEWGLPLSQKFAMFRIDGISVYAYGMSGKEYYAFKDRRVSQQNGVQEIDCPPKKLNVPFIACFEENIPDAVIKYIAKLQPRRAVFRDGCFADSPAKINVTEIFKMLAPHTRVKVI